MAGKRHPLPIRRAAEILLRETALSMAQIAAHLGLPPRTVQHWNCEAEIRSNVAPPGGVAIPPARWSVPSSDPPGRAQLEAALRGHIARQIAALDARLNREPAEADSARVLRDLGGLKRLLDDLPIAEASEGAADASCQDLPALRAEIARRYAAFCGEPSDPAVPGEFAGTALEEPLA